jgi:hypothetical protein
MTRTENRCPAPNVWFSYLPGALFVTVLPAHRRVSGLTCPLHTKSTAVEAIADVPDNRPLSGNLRQVRGCCQATGEGG